VSQSQACTQDIEQEFAAPGVRIGYIGARAGSYDEDAALLIAVGCRIVRCESPPAGSVLWSILSFIGPEDELVIFALSDLIGLSALEVLDRLRERGASLYVLDGELSTSGDGDRYLRAALNAVAYLQPKRRSAHPVGIEDVILSLRHRGVGPTEIARRLGVSRMTVWRKLKKNGETEALATR
jgi:DNA-binding phage protein